MRNIGDYQTLLSAALDGARMIERAAADRADAARRSGDREAHRAAHAAHVAAMTEVAEIEGEFDFPELLDDEERFPELVH